jgi:hypothetical protein
MEVLSFHKYNNLEFENMIVYYPIGLDFIMIQTYEYFFVRTQNRCII